MTAARSYTRPDFDAVRQEERSRLRELEAVGREFQAPVSSVREAYDAGQAPDAFRATWADRRRRQADEAARRALHPVDASEKLSAHAGRAAILRCAMGRPDLAVAYEEEHKIRRGFKMTARDAVERLIGSRSGGVDLAEIVRCGLETAALADNRAQLAAARGVIGAEPAAGLGAAVRDASHRVIADAWIRSGALWRAASRVVELDNFRPARLWCSRSGQVELADLAESAAPELLSDAAAAWPLADVQVKERMREIRLTRKRLVNVGLGELAAWISGAVASWSDQLDKLAAAALADAPEEIGGTASSALAAGVAALNRQTIGGLPLGSDGPRPLVIAGEGRRDLLGAQPGVPRADGDEGALVGRIVFSATVPEDFAAVIHGSFRPLAVPALHGEVAPQIALGPGAGVMLPGGNAVDPSAAAIRFDVGDPVALKTATAPAVVVGAVRVRVTQDGF